ncbi:MAG: zinc carboxypeptidase, partial [Balneolaceae bacterium]
IGNTNMAISNHSSFALSRKHIDREDGGDSLPAYGERERDATTNRVPGAIFRVTLDHTHPLAFGIDGDYFSLKTSAQSFDYLERGWNVGTVQESGPVTGFAGHSASQNLENSLSFGVQQHGSGSVVYMVDNPLFRAFWENGKLLFVNALFFVNN